MSGLHREIGDVLREHVWNVPAQACVCGYNPGNRDHGDHVADVLMSQLDINPLREQLMLTWARTVRQIEAER